MSYEPLVRRLTVRAQSLKSTAFLVLSLFSLLGFGAGCAEGIPPLGVHVPRARGTAGQATLSSAEAQAATNGADAPKAEPEGFALMGDDKLGFFVEFPRAATETRAPSGAVVWSAKGEGYQYTLSAQRNARGRAGLEEFATGYFKACGGEVIDRQVVTGYANPLVLFTGLCSGDKATVLYVSSRADRVVGLGAVRMEKRGVDRASPKFLQTLHFD